MRRRQFMALAAATLAAGAQAETTELARFRSMRRYAATRFGDIAYAERGSGPAALFLHAHPLNGFQWRGALERLASHRRCIAPDFLGLGYTRVADGQSVAPAAQAEMVVALLDKLGIDTVDLIGNDSGGAVAQLIVARHPQRVRTLLLTNCDEEQDSPPPFLQPLLALARAGKSTDVFPVWLADTAAARRDFGGVVYADPSILSADAVDYYFSPLISSARHKALVDATIVGFEPNPLAGIGAALKRSMAPTRIVWGMADKIFSPDSPERLERSFGNARGVRRLPNAKTFWPEEFPDILADEAKRLWNVT